MTIAFRIMVFFLIFNISSGVLNVALRDYFPEENYPDGIPTGYEYDENVNFANDFNGSAAAPGAEAESGWWDKFTDFLKIGFFNKVKTVLDNSLYGILGIFKDLGIMHEDYYVYFYSVLTVIYMLGIIDLFTGKKVTY